MMKPKILFADRRPMSDESMKILNDAGQVVWAEGDKESELIRDVKDAEVIITGSRLITRNVISAGNKLKAVIAYGVGFDHIDVTAATDKKVYVINTPGVNAVTVAEFAFGLMLSLGRKIPQLNASVKSGKWIRWELIGKELWGKTLGLVGLGRVGTYLATIAKGFGMKLLVYDPYVPKEKVVEIGGEPVTFDLVLSRSDFVVVCCLLTDETKGLISEKAIGQMKSTAYLINVARGPIVNEQALIKALQEKRIAGAGLDVFEKEPPSADNPLLKLDNVVASSHMAGLSMESTERIQLTVAEEAARILRGEEPKYLVNKELSRVKH